MASPLRLGRDLLEHPAAASARALMVLSLLVPAVPGRSGTSVPGDGFPLTVVARAADEVRFAPVASALAALAPREQLAFELELPGGGSVALSLQRVHVARPDARLFVDGQPSVTPLDADVTLWSGRDVEGGSAYFAFSPFGSRGWVRAGGRLWHLLAEPGPSGGWRDGGSRLVDDALLRAFAPAPSPSACQLLPAPGASLQARPVTVTSGADASGFLPLYEARVSVETDWQFTQVFGNVDAARAYAVSLLGAVSARYREQVGVVLTLPYLGMYSTSADPWQSEESGGSSIDLLFEFQDAWAFSGSPPVAADVYHFLSGASLGGGVAYLPGVCDQAYGFGVSGNLDGLLPLPVAPGALNWDFIVVAHELGHNFNALHTHDYCPPLDQCAPSGYFGACQVAEVCTTEGTVMSYCHICGAGMTNMTTYFHPQSVADMRAWATSSCLVPFEGVFTTDLGHAKGVPGSGTPSLAVAYEDGPDLLHLDLASAPPGKPGILFFSQTLLLAPFKGGVLVPGTELQVPIATGPAGSLSLALPVTFSVPDGIDIVTQAWVSAGGAVLAATNGVAFELIHP